MMSRRGSQTSLPDRLDENEQLLAAQADAVRAMNKTLKPGGDVVSKSSCSIHCGSIEQTRVP
jgi:hypothetical protein